MGRVINVHAEQVTMRIAPSSESVLLTALRSGQDGNRSERDKLLNMLKVGLRVKMAPSGN